MNYNYNGGQNFSGFSTTPWARAMAGIDPRFAGLEQGMYNADPSLALNSFLSTIRTSNTNEDLIRRMLPQIQKQWIQQQMLDARNGLGTLRPFSEMLTNFNWDRELARQAPEIRREYASQFQRPVRTVTF